MATFDGAGSGAHPGGDPRGGSEAGVRGGSDGALHGGPFPGSPGDAPALDAGERRAAGPEARLQHARDLAWRALNRRDRTVSELCGILAAKRVEPAHVDTVVTELCEQRFLDDAAYARRFAEDRRRLDDWGAERIERRLFTLGVDPEHIAAALAEQDPADELGAALELLRRRFPAVPETRRDRDRALGMLVRKGYELELALDALRRHAGVDELE